MRSLIVIFAAFAAVTCFGQATMTSSGDWATPSFWSGNNIGDLVTETVTINNNISPTVNNGANFTVSTTTLSNNNHLRVNSGGALTIGASGNPRNLITNNNAQVTVDGALIIWGNVQVNNNIVWSITGTVIIKGNLSLSNNANLNVTGGNLQVGGSFSSGNNANVSVSSGSIRIGSSVSVGNGSNLNGCAGCFSVGGTCNGPASFCGSGALPVTLISFEGVAEHNHVRLDWATATELNFDRFVVETSATGKDFKSIGSVAGQGTSSTLQKYSFDHTTPVTGINYYRLRSVDFDGTFELSSVVAVNVKVDKSVNVFPNPVEGSVANLFLNFDPGPARAVIYNNLGIPLCTIDNLVVGTTSFSHQLTPGVYLISVTSNSKTLMVRFSVK